MRKGLKLVISDADLSKPAKELVVVVHGLGAPVLMNDVVQLVREVRPDAHIAVADYNARLFSNEPPVELSRDLALEIGRKVSAARVRGAPYQSIVLVGHSIGALLIRAAYLMATGSEFTGVGRIAPESQTWARPARDTADAGPYVHRIVLLAGINNGWNAPAVERLGRHKRVKWAAITSCLTITAVTDRARFMRSVISGSPFVIDVRMNWLALVRESSQLEPPVLQLYGDRESLIPDGDVNDFIAGENFKYISVPGAGHFDIALLSDETLQQALKNKKVLRWKNRNLFRLFSVLLFRWLLPIDQITKDDSGIRKSELNRALTHPWHEIVSDAAGAKKKPAGVFDHVVFIRHGIRDEAGGWVAELKATIETLYPNAEVDATSVGRFSMLQFLFRGARIGRVYQFMHQYLNHRVKHPNAQFHFFGHSYGTYVGCKALRDYETCRFTHMALGNSVMARDFPWTDSKHPQNDLIGRRVEKVLNLRGSADCVVAWFPGLFQWLREMHFNLRSLEQTEFLGSAGFTGFNDDLHANPVILQGGHDAATKSKYHEGIARFLLEGNATFPKAQNQAPSSAR